MNVQRAQLKTSRQTIKKNFKYIKSKKSAREVVELLDDKGIKGKLKRRIGTLAVWKNREQKVQIDSFHSGYN